MIASTHQSNAKKWTEINKIQSYMREFLAGAVLIPLCGVRPFYFGLRVSPLCRLRETRCVCVYNRRLHFYNGLQHRHKEAEHKRPRMSLPFNLFRSLSPYSTSTATSILLITIQK